MNSAEYFAERYEEASQEVERLEEIIDFQKSCALDAVNAWEATKRRWRWLAIGALAAGMVLGFTLSGCAESVKVTGVAHEQSYDGDYSVSTVEFRDMDGAYTVWLWETPDFKEWHRVWMCDMDAFGCFAIDFRIRQNRWQLYDKSYKPCFWFYAVERMGDSEQTFL